MKIYQKIAIVISLVSVIPIFFLGIINFSNMRAILEASGTMEKQEVFSELDNLRDLNILISIILAFIFVAIALFFAKSISDPIKNLKKITDKISMGKLDVKLEEFDRKDEIGDLARSFERILVSLKLAMKETKEKEQSAKEKKTES